MSMTIQTNVRGIQTLLFRQNTMLQEKAVSTPVVPTLMRQPVTVTISKEGYKSWQSRMREMNASVAPEYTNADYIIAMNIHLSPNIDYDMWLSSEIYRNNEKDGSSWEKKAQNIVRSYTDIYTEIVQGYADGTRSIHVADDSQEHGYRTLTMEEELRNLDTAYENTVKRFEKRVEARPRELELMSILMEMQEGIYGKGNGNVTAKEIEQKYEDLKTVPDHLAQNMLSVRTHWHHLYRQSSASGAWQGVVNMIHQMFRTKKETA